MINNIPSFWKTKTWPRILKYLVAGVMFLSTATFADTHCLFESPSSVTVPGITLNVTQVESVPVGSIGQQLTSGWVYIGNSGIKTDCGNGGGDNAISQSLNNVNVDKMTGTTALYKTTIKGIDYELALVCKKTGDDDSCDGGEKIGTAHALPFGIGTWNHDSGAWYPWDADNQSYEFYIKVFQTADYKWAPGEATALSSSGEATRFTMNDTGVSVSTGQNLQINLLASFPTCETTMVTGSGVSGNTVALGDYNMDDLNTPYAVPFQLKLSECVGTNVSVKLNTNSREGTSDLLGNTTTSSSGSKGVAIRIKHSSTTMVPDGSTGFQQSMEPTTAIDLTVQLEKNGQSLQAGAFTSQAVFSISYE